ncbi:SDR family NAD(P)-dependent oxidoreductase [Paenibacillus tarimensis]|uniref:SDR family NAD(P)-dependent oxidoreductase n=1 Tax=Paenibacillus tarimensis TaxID=416012 RepID=UPI001F189C29|nr:SDR family NAD(P)-dependent oxidoreductase [Paenibacillus tarimensis]MCF2943977.1 SDR family NAD(P)-dependent oxidoreductase [Paenibacillus tarimensis]
MKEQIREKIITILNVLLQVPITKDNKQDSFIKLGLNSITIVQLAEQLSQETGTSIGVEILYDYATPDELAGYIAAMDGIPHPRQQSAVNGGAQAPGADQEKRYEQLKRGIVETLKGLLQPGTELDLGSSFFTLGLDSVSIVSLTEALNSRFGLQLGVETVFDNPSIEELTRYISGEYRNVSAGQELTTPEADASPGTIQNEKQQTAESRTSVNDLFTRQGEKIAIIGMSGKFAGADNINEYWDNLLKGNNAISEIRRNGWEERRYYSTNSQDRNKSISKWGGILPNIARFDAEFFNISPREAERTDPQQRLLLEEVYKALEDAGYPREKIQNEQVGVFIGARGSDYINKDVFHHNGIESQMFLGSDMGIMAGRISYFLNIHGPSLTVDTACSSALVALHLACDSLRKGECDMAIAGGVFVMPTPDFLVQASKTGMLSPDGGCKTFDNSANGIAVGEGVGAVLLKPLSRAIEDRDNIQAVISGSTVNQDGKTNGVTAPSAKAQERLVLKAWEQAGVDPESIAYLEVHGTGTKLGDPIEIKALTNAFRKHTDKKQFCWIGSHKPNIGHTINAAGLAGLMKAVLAIKNKRIPPTINYHVPNEHIDFVNSPFKINTGVVEWPLHGGSAGKAGVSSFGFSGTNCHVVLEEGVTWPKPSQQEDTYHLIPVSARSQSVLQKKLRQLREALATDGTIRLRDLARTLQEGRDHFQVRTAFIVKHTAELAEQLEAMAAGGAVQTPAAGLDYTLMNDYKRLHTVKELYEKGGNIDWKQLGRPDDSLLISLPAYPFGGEDYWISRPAAAPERKETIYSRTVEREHPVLSDHYILGNYLLPGAAQLAYVHDALDQALGGASVTIEDLCLLRPVIVNDSRAELQIELKPESDGYALKLGGSGIKPESVYAKCRAQLAAGGAPLLQFQPLYSSGTERMNGEEFYRKLAGKGARYGRTLQVVEEVEWSGEEVRAVLNVSAMSAADADRSAHITAVVDGALQCLLVYELDKPGMQLPFTIGSVHLILPFKERHRAAVSRTGTYSYDIGIYDLDGRLCAALLEVVIKPAKTSGALDLFYPVWRQKSKMVSEPSLRISPGGGRVLIVAARKDEGLSSVVHMLHREDEVGILYEDELSAASLQRYTGVERIYLIPEIKQQGIIWESPQEGKAAESAAIGTLYRLTKWMDSVWRDELVQLTVLTNNVYSTAVTKAVHPYPALIHGFVKSLRKEYPEWKIRLFDIDLEGGSGAKSEGLYKELEIAVSDLSPCGEYVLKNGQLYEQQLLPANLPAEKISPYRKQGVYVIVGGAGGIGLELCKHLARSVQARLAIIGRSALDARITGDLEAITQLGGQYLYLQADITDAGLLESAVRRVKQAYGAVHGVFHSALVLKDTEIRRMTEDMLQAVLDPKVTGVRNLYAAFKSEPLDFMLFFSSCQTFVGNPGQSNYAAASSFEDAFCQYLQDQSLFPVKVINWGYWGSVGVVSGEAYQRMMQLQGYHSIEPAEGMEMIDFLLASPLNQLVVMKAEQAVYEHLPVNRGWTMTGSPEETDAVLNQLAWNLPSEAPNPAAIVSFLDQLRLLQNEAKHKLAGLVQRSGAAFKPKFSRLLQELSHFDTAVDGLSGGRRTAVAAPEIKGFADLLHACLEHYEDILTGRLEATDVMFPQSSMQLVEAVYRNNPLSDYCIGIAAGAVQSALSKWRALHPGRTIRIIEIGAGTGSTAEAVCRAISGFANISYTYTDISHSFLNYGRRKLGTDYPFVDFALLDIEKDIAAQGLAAGSYDLVIATNVLHATANMSAVLENVKRLLKRNGLLIVNEMTRKQDYLTITFGLLDGWWKYEDGVYRETGSPILNERSWNRLLKQEGFRHIQFHGLPQDDPALWSQHVIMAESDGYMKLADNRQGSPSRAKADERKEAPAAQKKEAGAGSARRNAVIMQVRASIAGCLGIKPELLDMEKPFAELGVDSIVAVEIVADLNSKLKIKLKNTVLFDYNDGASLLNHLLTKHQEELFPAADESEEDLTAAADFEKAGEAMQAEAPAREAEKGIAIIGISGRFADYEDVNHYWQGLCEGRSSIREIPKERWDTDEFYDPNIGNYEKTNSKWCGWLTDAGEFDPLFFNLSGTEAIYTDPQQRIFLEECWKALEDAGQLGAQLKKQKYGVFAGIMEGDYLRRLQMLGVKLEPQAFWGNDSAILASRISYLLDLHGPCVTVNTACSSSLVAIHLACQSIISGESDVAIAGGSYVSTTPNYYILSSNAGMFSPDGLCKTFDQSANGFVLGEGAGVVVLKSLDKAVVDGDFIYGVIKGIGINQDGRTNGITAPSGLAQTSLELEVYEKSGIHPETISYVEAHGTGTKLGDPIEFEALTNAFRTYTNKKQYCGIGSVKTNIGHLSAAAGVASLIKVLLAMRHRMLPPSIHFNQINENIDVEDSPFYVNTKLSPWEPTGHNHRRAAISSFGFSGTNAHLVVEEWPVSSYKQHGSGREESLVVFSAKTMDRLEAYLAKFAVYVESLQKDTDHERAALFSLRNIAYSLQTGRKAMKCRAAFVVSSLDELLDKLSRYLRNEHALDVFSGVVAANDAETDELLAAEPVRSLRMDQIASLWIQGAEIEWGQLYTPDKPVRIPLPTSVFLRRKYWFEGSLSAASSRPDGNLPAIQAESEPGKPGLNEPELQEHHLFEEVWQEDIEEARQPISAKQRRIILVLDKDEQMFNRLLAEGESEFILGIQGVALIKIDARRYIFDPGNMHAFISTLAKDGIVPDTVVNLRSFQGGTAGPEAHSLFYLSLVQAQQELAGEREISILHVFENRYNADSAAQAALSGFARTLRTESPKLSLRTVMVDRGWIDERGLPADSSAASGAAAVQLEHIILRELRSSPEVEVRYSHDRRYVKRLKAWNAPIEKTGPVLKPGGVYVITGGMGSIGRIIARRMASEYKAKLAICGRSHLRKEDGRFLAELEQAGASVKYYPVDLASGDDTRRMIRQVMDVYGKIDGVFHCAGVVASSLLRKKSAAEFAATLKPKLSGVIHLDQALSGESLDFIALFSSISSELGTMYIGDYAYANSFLNHFAKLREERRKRGECSGAAIALCWPYWKDGGMAIDRQGQDYMRDQYGMEPLEAEAGWRLLQSSLSSGKHELVVVCGDRTKIEAKFTEEGSAGSVPGRTASSLEAIPAAVQAAVQAEVPAAASAGKQETVIRRLTAICSELFDIAERDIDSSGHFEEIGMNSIFMMKLLKRIEETFGKTVDPDAIMNYPSIRRLSAYLISLGINTGEHEPAADTRQAQQQETPAIVNEPAVQAGLGRAGGVPRIAVIGISCRFPGADSPEEFWSNLIHGRELLRTVDSDRWNGLNYANPDNKLAESHAQLKWGGFLNHIDAFDARYFNVNDKDAAILDPQHRLLLELAQELFDHAGYSKESLSGQHVNVLIGAGDSSYVKLHKHHIPVEHYDHVLVNMIPNMIAARVSDYYNLKGEAGIVDTACSSALVAIHKACDEIRLGKCKMAVAGGVKLLIDPFEIAGFNQAGILAADGKVRVFDEQAKGTVLGEGAGLVLLKDYDAAVRDGDRIWAVISGSAVNNDGKTMGLTVPSKEGQREVITQAIANSGVDVEKIRCFEAHGTGTLLGDPIEIKAASEAYRQFTDRVSYCAVGSVKSNMGHLLQASGIAGFMKLALSLYHKQIVPTLNCSQPHPRFKFSETPFYPSLGVEDLSAEQGAIYAAMSAFGFGGTNCHLIMENFDAANVPNYSPVREPLPKRVWRRNRYWLGREAEPETVPVTTTGPAVDSSYMDVLQQVRSGSITPEAAAQLIRQQRSKVRN